MSAVNRQECSVFLPQQFSESLKGEDCPICLDPVLESDKLTQSIHSGALHERCFFPEGLPPLHRCPLCRAQITSVNGTPVQQPQAQEEDAAFLEGPRRAAQRNIAREQVVHRVALGHVLASSNTSNPMSKKMKALYVLLFVGILCSLFLSKITIVPLIVLIILFTLLFFWHKTAPCREDREIAMNEHRQLLRQPILREVE